MTMETRGASAHNGYTLDRDRLDCHTPRHLKIFGGQNLKISIISKQKDLFCNSKIDISRPPANFHVSTITSPRLSTGILSPTLLSVYISDDWPGTFNMVEIFQINLRINPTGQNPTGTKVYLIFKMLEML